MATFDHEEHVRHKFDSFCKKVIKNQARDIQREFSYVFEHEKSLEDLSPKELERLAYFPEYTLDDKKFSVAKFDVVVKDILIAEALDNLSELNREIILSYYFLDMSDKEIAEYQKLARVSIQRRRKRALQKLKKIMEGFIDE